MKRGKRHRQLLVPRNDLGRTVLRLVARRDAWRTLLTDPPGDLLPGTLTAWRKHAARADRELTLAVGELEDAGFEIEEKWHEH